MRAPARLGLARRDASRGALVHLDLLDLVFTAYTNHPGTGKRLLTEMLELDPMPTAVLVMSDALAAGVVRGALEAGLRVPEDLSVVGFDDIPLAALTEPPLTTVSQPIEHKGELTARALLRALDPEDGGGAPRTQPQCGPSCRPS